LGFLLDWAQVTDLSTHIDKLAAELLELAVLGDLMFGLANGGRVGERFRHGFTLDFEGQAEIGTMAGLFGLMAATVRFATTTTGGSNRARAQVIELDDLFDYLCTLLFQGFQGLRHFDAS